MRNEGNTYLQHIIHNMSLIDRFLAVLAPYECLGCQTEGSLLCKMCTQQLPSAAECCYRCEGASPGGDTCHGCAADGSIRGVRAATDYAGAAKALVWKLKFAGATAAAGLMAACMQPLLAGTGFSSRMVLIPVPTARTRARQRGYDQAKLLARALSRQTGLPYLDCLVRHGNTHQVGASRQVRLDQLQGAFRVRTPAAKLRGVCCVLVDDVITTGATLEVAAKALQAQGVRNVYGLVFARTAEMRDY